MVTEDDEVGSVSDLSSAVASGPASMAGEVLTAEEEEVVK